MNYDIKRKLEKLNIAVVELQDTESENHKKYKPNLVFAAPTFPSPTFPDDLVISDWDNCVSVAVGDGVAAYIGCLVEGL